MTLQRNRNTVKQAETTLRPIILLSNGKPMMQNLLTEFRLLFGFMLYGNVFVTTKHLRTATLMNLTQRNLACQMNPFVKSFTCNLWDTSNCIYLGRLK